MLLVAYDWISAVLRPCPAVLTWLPLFQSYDDDHAAALLLLCCYSDAISVCDVIVVCSVLFMMLIELPAHAYVDSRYIWIMLCLCVLWLLPSLSCLLLCLSTCPCSMCCFFCFLGFSAISASASSLLCACLSSGWCYICAVLLISCPWLAATLILCCPLLIAPSWPPTCLCTLFLPMSLWTAFEICCCLYVVLCPLSPPHSCFTSAPELMLHWLLSFWCCPDPAAVLLPSAGDVLSATCCCFCPLFVRCLRCLSRLPLLLPPLCMRSYALMLPAPAC